MKPPSNRFPRRRVRCVIISAVIVLPVVVVVPVVFVVIPPAIIIKSGEIPLTGWAAVVAVRAEVAEHSDLLLALRTAPQTAAVAADAVESSGAGVVAPGPAAAASEAVVAASRNGRDLGTKHHHRSGTKQQAHVSRGGRWRAAPTCPLIDKAVNGEDVAMYKRRAVAHKANSREGLRPDGWDCSAVHSLVIE